MIERSVLCLGPHGFYRMAFVEWPGPKGPPPLLCVHGLTRNGRDFDRLAAALSAERTVYSPDMPGRGKSEWFADPADYSYPTYLSACAALVGHIDAPEVDWVGTSMGGIIGMFLASLPGTPIRRLVLNDIGALIPADGLRRLSNYVGADPTFADMGALEADLRKIAATFGTLSDRDWADLARTSARHRPDGSLTYAYDSRIAAAVRQAEPQDVDLWASYDAIRAPTLILRGAESDLLRHDTAVAMTERGPHAKLVELPGIGHAPALMAEEQIALVRDFLRG